MVKLLNIVSIRSVSYTHLDVYKRQAFAQGLSGVRKGKSSDVTADSITTLSSLVGYASIGIVVILMLVSIFLISNTITIGITCLLYTSRCV